MGESIIRKIESFPYVQIRGEEFYVKSWPVNNSEDVKNVIFIKDLCHDVNLLNYGYREKYYGLISRNSFIDGCAVDGMCFTKIDLDLFLSKIEDGIMKQGERFVNLIGPFHIIRQSEVEKFYEYTSTIVINGIECDRFVDAGVGYFGYHDEYPEYVEIEGDKYEEAIATIPQEDLKLITIGNAKDGLGTKYIIPKKYIDKIILRRKYLHTDLIEFCLEKFYTGEEDVFELDPKKPDPKVLEMMKEYRVIINSIWE